MGKQKELIVRTFKIITHQVWNTQTPYANALSYQTPTSKNCKPFKTQLCESLLVAHEMQTLNTYTTKLKSFQWTPISNFMPLKLNN